MSIYTFFCLLKKAIRVKSKQFMNWTVGLCFVKRSRIGQSKMINILSVCLFVCFFVSVRSQVRASFSGMFHGSLGQDLR